jgi:hypothetical protein
MTALQLNSSDIPRDDGIGFGLQKVADSRSPDDVPESIAASSFMNDERLPGT